ncbi:MAG: glycosyltransferase family 2 protein [Candidatus Babeliales bacterium]|nr:glycosyltransferase family 2 protein [Candidatus Babeliales bacterium]
MLKILRWLFVGCCFFSINNIISNERKAVYTNQLNEHGEREIVIIIPSYNNKEWYERNLDSVVNQCYQNYSIIYVNDCSTDGTGELVAQYIKDRKLEHRIKLINNTKRKGALANFYSAIYASKDTSIIATIDGDDWLRHDKVLAIVNAAYDDQNVWLTYGNYTHYPYSKDSRSCCEEFPKKVMKKSMFREHHWVSAHLRTFYAFLFKNIKIDDLMHDGEFFPMTWDQAMMLPMLEMCGNRFKFISEKIYVYNIDNPINDSKKDVRFQVFLEKLIHEKPKYNKLKKVKLISKVFLVNKKNTK